MYVQASYIHTTPGSKDNEKNNIITVKAQPIITKSERHANRKPFLTFTFVIVVFTLTTEPTLSPCKLISRSCGEFQPCRALYLRYTITVRRTYLT